MNAIKSFKQTDFSNEIHGLIYLQRRVGFGCCLVGFDYQYAYYCVVSERIIWLVGCLFVG